MGLFGKLLGTAIDVVTSPIEVVKDAATLGGLCTGEDETYISKRLRRLAKDADEVRDGIEDL
jgi:hypothetical protein